MRQAIRSIGVVSAAACGLLSVITATLALWRAEPSRWTDGHDIDTSSSQLTPRQVLWTPARPARDRSDVEEYEPRVSSDGQMMLMVRRRPGQNADLYACTWTAKGWSEPAPLEAVNSPADELGPELSPSGDRLYFYSDRDGGLGGYDVWVTRRTASGWSEPQNLGPSVNTAANEYGAALTPAGDRLYFSSNRARRGEPVTSPDAWRATVRERRARHDYDLYVAALDAEGLPTASSAPVHALNTSHDEASPAVSPAGDFVYFASDRPGGVGGYDVWRARLSGDHVAAPEGLGPAVNSTSNDLDPALSTDGFRLYFSSDRRAGTDAEAAPPSEPLPEPTYALWMSGSREVYLSQAASSFWSRWAAAWRTLLPWLAPLIAVALFMLLARKLWRDPVLRGRFVRLSLLAQCLVISVLVHMMIASGLAVWKVSAAMGDLLATEGGGVAVALETAGVDDGAIAQLRGEGTFAEAVAIPAHSLPAGEHAPVPAGVSEASPITLAPMTELAPPAPPLSEPDLRPIATLPSAPTPSTIVPRSELEVAMPVQPEPARAVREAVAGALPNFTTPGVDAAMPPRAVGADAPIAVTPPALPATAAALPSTTSMPVAVGDSGAMTQVQRSVPDLPAVPDARVTALPTPEQPIAVTTEPTPQVASSSFAGSSALVAPIIATQGAPMPAMSLPVLPSASSSAGPVGTSIQPSAPVAAPGAATSREVGSISTADGAPNVALPRLPTAPAPAASSSQRGIALSIASAPSAPVPAPGARAEKNGTERITVPLKPLEVARALPISPTDVLPPPMTGSDVAARGTRTSLGGIDLGSSTTSPTLPQMPVPVETFTQRAPELRQDMLERMGGSASTEQAVALALAWLQRVQEQDGRWSGRDFDQRCKCGDPAQIDADVAMTSMALLCFLGAGHTHQADGPYRDAVGRGLAWIIAGQAASGDLRRGETMYGHTIATVMLCEALAMSRDPKLLVPTQRAVAFVLAPPSTRRGGAQDTSVIGWQVMAVESARRAGLIVPPGTFTAARSWLDAVAKPDAPGTYAYRAGAAPSPAMTAEAMFVQQLLGRRREEPRMEESAQFILQTLPQWKEGASTHYWYYATLAMFQHQGEAWRRWNEALVPQLITHQRKDGSAAGSWDPQDDLSRLGGRIYQTAVCTLSLEVYYRYRPAGMLGTDPR